jgi:predicted nucleotidyltransferase
VSSDIPGTVLLAGVVGSVAYGLADEFSDVDRLGTYAAPTIAFHGLHPPAGKAASHVTTGPDATYHEAGKLVSLLLKANPTVTELLWLEEYETRTPLGEELAGIRLAFLSAKAVRNAYLGYASQQFVKLSNRGDGSFSSDTRKRTAKDARHLWRLIRQGTALHESGSLTVRLDDAQVRACREFGEDAVTVPGVARDLLAAAEHSFSERGVLPDRPDERAAEAWLHRVRAACYEEIR